MQMTKEYEIEQITVAVEYYQDILSEIFRESRSRSWPTGSWPTGSWPTEESIAGSIDELSTRLGELRREET